MMMNGQREPLEIGSEEEIIMEALKAAITIIAFEKRLTPRLLEQVPGLPQLIEDAERVVDQLGWTLADD
jgi:hypothetical protein